VRGESEGGREGGREGERDFVTVVPLSVCVCARACACVRVRGMWVGGFVWVGG
jgi:hypothetical protein